MGEKKSKRERDKNCKPFPSLNFQQATNFVSGCIKKQSLKSCNLLCCLHSHDPVCSTIQMKDVFNAVGFNYEAIAKNRENINHLYERDCLR